MFVLNISIHSLSFSIFGNKLIQTIGGEWELVDFWSFRVEFNKGLAFVVFEQEYAWVALDFEGAWNDFFCLGPVVDCYHVQRPLFGLNLLGEFDVLGFESLRMFALWIV